MSVPTEFADLVLENGSAEHSFQLVRGTVLDRDLLHVLTQCYGGDFSLTARGARLVVTHGTKFPPNLELGMMRKISCGKEFPLPPSMKDLVAPALHEKWAGAVSWATKCLRACIAPKCTTISGGKLVAVFTTDSVWGQELHQLLGRNLFATCRVYVKKQHVIVLTQLA